MQIIVLADPAQKAELLQNAAPVNVTWITNASLLLEHKEADVFFDLQFVNTNERKVILQQLLPKLVVVASVVDTLAEIHPSFVRINGWPTFLSSPLIEAFCGSEANKQVAEKVFSFFNKKIEWVRDEPGFITARVVSMIINEAYLALSEGVSTKEEINTAMKLGTAYPYGPFEWAQKIGVQNIAALLKKLSGSQLHYLPADALFIEAEIAM